ncbi:AbrB/MazE/SpoVT family DNA-binding domain-containing protein [Candidatus Woesearchaeota archaeon]|nr:AbrB/MazE/SpoVT family DNA-binding domain-containing protein [Candidatus Woesearchaeota archaeon]
MIDIKTVTVSEKGQISIPTSIRALAGIEKGDTLLLIHEKDQILLKKAKRLHKETKDEFSHLLKHSEDVAKKLWGSKADDVWDTI